MNIDKVERDICYGCGLCAEICPTSAIEMQEDTEGLLYPFMNNEECIQCGKCYRMCPTVLYHTNVPKMYKMVKNIDEIRMISASGGAFWAIAEYVILKGGIVYGAAFDDNMALKHIRCKNMDEVKQCCGSKYLQSEIVECYEKIKEDIQNNRMVLFVGTPCQTTAVRNMCGNYDKIIVVDLICNGVIGKSVFRQYIESIKKKYSSHVTKVCFRDKTKGWSSQHWKAITKSGQSVDEKDLESYKLLYTSHYAHRYSCSKCQFANISRAGDITIGDYWGINKHYPQDNDEKGVSLVMINTEIGKKIANEIDIIKKGKSVTKEECMQLRLKRPIEIDTPKRKLFYNTYLRKGYEKAIKTMFSNKLRYKLVRKFKCLH